MAGRKDRYETHVKPYIDRIPKWRRDGQTEEQISKQLGVAVSTFNLYKNQHPELLNALKRGKEYLIEELEDSLYKKAIGFEYEEVKQVVEKDDNGKDKKRVEKTTRRSLPDTGALAFALKNLAPDKWRDRRDIEISKSTDEAVKEMEEYFEQQKKADA